MQRLFSIMLMLCMAVCVMAQGLVKGTVYDKQNDEPISFATIKVVKGGATTPSGGGTTDADGKFHVAGLGFGSYTLTITCVGYKDVVRHFTLSQAEPQQSYAKIYMSEDAKQLKEVTVTGQKATMKLEVDRKTFDVSQLISSAGQAASDLLENIPSVEVDNEGNVSLRGNSSVEVWINGKASGLTTDNRAQILQQLPAESIERIEVIDNPSAKFSAEGSAGIINIVLKKERQAGYYGSVQAGADTHGGYNGSFNINYNSSLFDAYANVGYRHMLHKGHTESEQKNYKDGELISTQDYNSDEKNWGNHPFVRAGLTMHATKKDDFTVSGMYMNGSHNNSSTTPYYFGKGNDVTSILRRSTDGEAHMKMMHGEAGYTHEFGTAHKLDMNFSADQWKSDNNTFYRDQNTAQNVSALSEYKWQYRPQNINTYSYEYKLDYENQITRQFKLESGYNWKFSHENTPQESYMRHEDNASSTPDWFNNLDSEKDYDEFIEKPFYNRFIYDMTTHALYATANYHVGKLGVMAGLRGEYWRVNTESYDWWQENNVENHPKDKPFKKDYFKLFPSLFMSYQLTPNDQLQLNYTRRLHRPWGGQLNSFKDTRDATVISFGNPELTPEYSNSFSFNYLRTWTEHSMLVSLYYRPTSDVMQRINYMGTLEDGSDIMYSTSMNLSRSISSGAEVTVKNKLFKILDLTTNVNAYYYKLDGFEEEVEGQPVRGEAQKRFTWNARMQASVILPYDISVQLSGRYRSKQAITQGTRPASYMMDFGVRKNFFNKLFTLSINCRDLLNSRRWETTTEGPDFWRHQINRHDSRCVSATLTWNFGNMKSKKRDHMGDDHDHGGDMQDYNSAGMEY